MHFYAFCTTGRPALHARWHPFVVARDGARPLGKARLLCAVQPAMRHGCRNVIGRVPDAAPGAMMSLPAMLQPPQGDSAWRLMAPPGGGWGPRSGSSLPRAMEDTGCGTSLRCGCAAGGAASRQPILSAAATWHCGGVRAPERAGATGGVWPGARLFAALLFATLHAAASWRLYAKLHLRTARDAMRRRFRMTPAVYLVCQDRDGCAIRLDDGSPTGLWNQWVGSYRERATSQGLGTE